MTLDTTSLSNQADPDYHSHASGGAVDNLGFTFTITTFRGVKATTKEERVVSLRSLVPLILITTATIKADLPLLKLATFGSTLTRKGSFRHDANVLEITGIEADYDGETLAVDKAVKALKAAGILSMVYTSPSHTKNKPRWRVICPTSVALPPEDRARLMDRLNGALGGVFKGESWTLSQSFYYGSVNKNIAHVVKLIDGKYIDLCEHLDLIAISKPTKTEPAPAEAGTDTSRSALAFRLGSAAVRQGANYAGMIEAIKADPEGAAWCIEKGHKNKDRELKRIFERSSLPEWMLKYQFGESGPIHSLGNVMIALREAPELKNCFAFNQMEQVTFLKTSLPEKINDIVNCLISDNDVSRTQLWLQQRGGLTRISNVIVQQAVILRGLECSYHPVRDYLNALVWDNVPRLTTWLNDHFKTGQSLYNTGIGTMFMIAMVARIMEPGCKSDHVMVLEGLQGEQKSTAGKVLAGGGQWFSDTLPDLHHNPIRTSQHMRGKWLIELGELSAMRKSEIEEVRRFITQTEEKYTPLYGHNEVHEPRQCIFIGTTNEEIYFKGEERRFWPVKIGGKIDLDKLAAARDQLFAEAVVYYHRGDKWWPDSEFEATHIKPEQAERVEEDPWVEQISKWLANKPRVTLGQIAIECLQIPQGNLSTTVQRRIVAVLKNVGWLRNPIKITGYHYWESQKFVQEKHFTPSGKPINKEKNKNYGTRKTAQPKY